MNQASFPAIVLSFDRHHPLAEHMMLTYDQHWPSHPFRFHLPYQEYPAALCERFGARILPVETPSGIRDTVLTLLNGLDDEQWVYWCIDDKYLVDLNEVAANRCLNWVTNETDPEVCGVLFCRSRKLLAHENLRGEGRQFDDSGDLYLERRNYYQIWIPQFLRVKVLRGLFEGFPDRPFRAKEMDNFTGQEPGQRPLEVKRGQKLYVSSVNRAVFGESTRDGRLTRNCNNSMAALGLSTAGFEVDKHNVFIGRL